VVAGPAGVPLRWMAAGRRSGGGGAAGDAAAQLPVSPDPAASGVLPSDGVLQCTLLVNSTAAAGTVGTDRIAGVDLRCGLFDVDLELLEDESGALAVVVSEAGCRPRKAAPPPRPLKPGSSAAALASSAVSAVDTDGRDAAIVAHLGELPDSAEILVFAVVVRNPAVLEKPLILVMMDGSSVVHKVHRVAASGVPGTLLAVVSRHRSGSSGFGSSSPSAWHVYDVLPNSSSVVCGDRESTIVRELYWPEVGVAIQRSSPDAGIGGRPAVSWLEVFQALPEGSLDSSDDDKDEEDAEDEDVGYMTSGGSSASAAPLPQKTRPSGLNRPAAIAGTKLHRAAVACSYAGEEPLPKRGSIAAAVPRVDGGGPRPAALAASVACAPGGRFPWAVDAEGGATSAVAPESPAFGASLALVTAAAAAPPQLTIGSPIDASGTGCDFSLGGSFSRSAQGRVHAQELQGVARWSVEFGEEMRVATEHLQSENVALRQTCDSQAQQLEDAVRLSVELGEELRRSIGERSEDSGLLQKTCEEQLQELGRVEGQNATLSDICEVRAEELRDASTRHTVSETEQWEQTAGLRHEVGQLRALLGNHESQLSQSQELAQQLRRDALGHSEVRHVVAAELATEGVHAGRLEHRLHEELVEAARYRSDWSTLQGELAMIRNEHGDLKSELRQSAEVAADYASVDAQRRRQLEGLGAELAEAEQEFQRELAVLRGRLSSADLRNQRLCENLRQAVQVASTQAEPGQKPASPAPPPGADPAAAVAKMAENMNVSQMSAAGPASPELLAPSFTSDSGSTRSDGGCSFFDHGMQRAKTEVSQVAPKSQGKPRLMPRAGTKPMSLQGDYHRFVDTNLRSSATHSAAGSCSTSPRSASAGALSRGSLSQPALKGRPHAIVSREPSPAVFLNDVSEGGPELGFGPGGPGSSSLGSGEPAVAAGGGYATAGAGSGGGCWWRRWRAASRDSQEPMYGRATRSSGDIGAPRVSRS